MSPAGTLALKLLLTPVLVGGASLAARRWGAGVGGWLVGIPLTSGPIAFFLALGQGANFAAEAAAGILAGAGSQAAFCLAYAWTARRFGWPVSLTAGAAAFAAMTVVLINVVAPVSATFAGVAVGLLLSLAFMPRKTPVAVPGAAAPAWDVPARIVVATTFVIALTAAGPTLGPRLAGLLAPFPVYAAVLATFAHRAGGPVPAAAVLSGLLLGLFSFAVFFLALAELLVPAGVTAAFVIATVLAAGVHATTLAAGRRWRIA